MKRCSLTGPGSHCHPVMNGASARRNTLFVLEVSVRLKGILHKPNQGVCAYVTRLARACEAPSSSHCPEWEQSSFEDLTHKLSATPCTPPSLPAPHSCSNSNTNSETMGLCHRQRFVLIWDHRLVPAGTAQYLTPTPNPDVRIL